MPVTTEDAIAPEELITLVSCNCNGNCSNNLCTCKKNNVACTDFCGCGDLCENIDMCPPENVSDENNEEEEGGEEVGEEEEETDDEGWKENEEEKLFDKEDEDEVDTQETDRN